MQNNLKELLADAQKKGYAIPAFNYSNLWDLTAIVEAANEENAPVIIACLPKVIDAFSINKCSHIGKGFVEDSKTPVIHHLDHSESISLCKSAVDLGYSSVMIDASKLSLEDNINSVKEVVDYAHKRNVCVEGEIGRIKGRGYEGNFEGGDFLVQVPDAIELVKKSNLDSLAVGIGTAHGFYEGKPELNFKRLAEINNSIDIPLVLHGGTGIPKDDVQKAIKNGICKVNVGTMIRYTYLSELKNELEMNSASVHPAEINKPIVNKLKKVIKSWIRVCMAENRA